MALTNIFTRTAAAMLGLAALGLAAAPSYAQTTIYNFEVQGNDYIGGDPTLYNGTGALAGSGTTWNVLTNNGFGVSGSSSVSNALTSTGGASSVGFTAGYTGVFGIASGNTSKDPDQLLDNYAYTYSDENGPQHLLFSGLAADSAFTLDLYGDDFNHATTFTLTDSGYMTSLQTANAPDDQGGDFVQDETYVQFRGVTDDQGKVYATYQADLVDESTEGDFSGAQIQVGSDLPASAAPEPSQFAGLGLTVLGLGGLLLAARKKRAAASA